MAEFKMGRLDDNVHWHVQVKVSNELRFRTWLATRLIWLAFKIMGGRITIEKVSE